MIQKGDYKEALEYGKSIEDKFTDDPDYYFIMGSAYYIMESWKNALLYFDRVLEMKHYDLDALELKANTHLKLEDKKAVIETCEKILEIDSDNDDAKRILDEINSQ